MPQNNREPGCTVAPLELNNLLQLCTPPQATDFWKFAASEVRKLSHRPLEHLRLCAAIQELDRDGQRPHHLTSLPRVPRQLSVPDVQKAVLRFKERLLGVSLHIGTGGLSRLSASIHAGEKDYHVHLADLQSSGEPDAITMATFIALCSSAMGRPIQSQMAVMGDMTLGGTISPARNLADSLQVAFDASAKRILLPMSSVGDIPSVPGELFAKFQTSFYSDPVDAAFKALGVE